jgi:hypothetical protein
VPRPLRAKPLPAELVAFLPACAKHSDVKLTRGELALVFNVCPRTVARWEEGYRLPLEIKNARVLRYPPEAVVQLCARGHSLDRELATRFGLVPEVILELAAKHANQPKSTPRMPIVSPVLLIQDDDDRKLLQLWRDLEKGAALRQVVRAMSN